MKAHALHQVLNLLFKVLMVVGARCGTCPHGASVPEELRCGAGLTLAAWYLSHLISTVIPPRTAEYPSTFPHQETKAYFQNH